MDLEECFVDDMFTPTKKVAKPWARPSVARGPTKRMAAVQKWGLPVALSVYSASLHEMTLVEPMLAQRTASRKPKRLIGDKA